MLWRGTSDVSNIIATTWQNLQSWRAKHSSVWWQTIWRRVVLSSLPFLDLIRLRVPADTERIQTELPQVPESDQMSLTPQHGVIIPPRGGENRYHRYGGSSVLVYSYLNNSSRAHALTNEGSRKTNTTSRFPLWPDDYWTVVWAPLVPWSHVARLNINQRIYLVSVSISIYHYYTSAVLYERNLRPYVMLRAVRWLSTGMSEVAAANLKVNTYIK